MNKFTVPDLPYAYNALEPYIDAKTMEIHHDKHHAAYVSKLNAALDKYPALYDETIEKLLMNLRSVPEDIRDEVRNNGGGHFNHSLFWKLLGSEFESSPSSDFEEILASSFGSLDGFKKLFEDAAVKRFGSGWAWLSLNAFGKLTVHSTPNQDSPLLEELFPVIGLDVWEHAYYLSYQNRRADYITAFWKVINWKQAEINYRNALKDKEECFSPGRTKRAA